MRRLTIAFALPLVAVFLMAGCSSPGEQGSPAQTAQTPEPSGSADQNLDIAFKSDPAPPQTGENQFEVTVKAADGTPVTDAEVSIELYMPAMPSMNMAEMRNSIPLKHDANGVYRGSGSVMMTGGWEVTTRVRRAGQELGSRKLIVMATEKK